MFFSTRGSSPSQDTASLPLLPARWTGTSATGGTSTAGCISSTSLVEGARKCWIFSRNFSKTDRKVMRHTAMMPTPGSIVDHIARLVPFPISTCQHIFDGMRRNMKGILHTHESIEILQAPNIFQANDRARTCTEQNKVSSSLSTVRKSPIHTQHQSRE